MADGKVTAAFGTSNHNGMMVPVYADGMGAPLFSGVLDNSGIAEKIRSLLPQKNSSVTRHSHKRGKKAHTATSGKHN